VGHLRDREDTYVIRCTPSHAEASAAAAHMKTVRELPRVACCDASMDSAMAPWTSSLRTSNLVCSTSVTCCSQQPCPADVTACKLRILTFATCYWLARCCQGESSLPPAGPRDGMHGVSLVRGETPPVPQLSGQRLNRMSATSGGPQQVAAAQPPAPHTGPAWT